MIRRLWERVKARHQREAEHEPHAVYRRADGSWSGPFPSLPTSEVPNSESAADVRSALTDGLYRERRKR